MKYRVIFGLLISVFFIAGCAGLKKGNSSSSSGLIEPRMMTKFSDIPVPAGFKALPQLSYSFETSGVRIGLLKYQGKADPEQVVNFYKEQMPMNNWRLLNIIEYGERLLNFDREQETCIITLLSKGKNITITIAIGPKAQSAKKADKPIK